MNEVCSFRRKKTEFVFFHKMLSMNEITLENAPLKLHNILYNVEKSNNFEDFIYNDLNALEKADIRMSNVYDDGDRYSHRKTSYIIIENTITSIGICWFSSNINSTNYGAYIFKKLEDGRLEYPTTTVLRKYAEKPLPFRISSCVMM
jgi:hypothetical protein